MMEAAIMEIPIGKRDIQRRFKLDKSFREAVRDHLRHRWPTGTAKSAAHEYGLTLDKAREAAAGRASLTTIEAIFKRGGPPVFLPILEEVWGQSIARFFYEMGVEHAENGRRLAALVSDPWAGPGAGGDGAPGGPRVGADRSHPARRKLG